MFIKPFDGASRRGRRIAFFACLIFGTAVSAADAQQINGTPGAPNATTTIDGHVLPPPPQKFGGQIGLNAAQSKPYWPMRVVPPKGAPEHPAHYDRRRRLFGALDPSAASSQTPALDRIAANGLRYTNFHTTSLCSPTRAALITGRNHHSVGFGVVSEAVERVPRLQQPSSPRDSATIARILQREGYRTSWLGKAHNTPTYQGEPGRAVRPMADRHGLSSFLRIPWRRLSSQWEPQTSSATRRRFIRISGKQGKWNLTTAMADDAIHWLTNAPTTSIQRCRSSSTTCRAARTRRIRRRPNGSTKISDLHLFDKGWTNRRARPRFCESETLGVIPQEAKLTPWPDNLLKNWDTLNDEEKKLFIRQANVYAAYLAYTDHEIGLVIQAVEDLGSSTTR